MESLHDIFTEMRLANKPTFDINDWLTLREIAEEKNITVDELLKIYGREETENDLRRINEGN